MLPARATACQPEKRQGCRLLTFPGRQCPIHPDDRSRPRRPCLLPSRPCGAPPARVRQALPRRPPVQHLLNLLAAIALLVWATHIVRTGVLRLYGANLRHVISRSVGNRFQALLAGFAVTTLVQSSTATGLIVASFVGRGLIATAAALAVMLGADIGTSAMVVVFSFDLSWLSPLLIFVGVVLFISRETTSVGRFGRIVIGVGLITLALAADRRGDTAADRFTGGAPAAGLAAQRRAARHPGRRGADGVVLFVLGHRAADGHAGWRGHAAAGRGAGPGARRQRRQWRAGCADHRALGHRHAPPADGQPDLQVGRLPVDRALVAAGACAAASSICPRCRSRWWPSTCCSTWRWRRRSSA